MIRVPKRSGAALATLMIASSLALAPGPALAVDGKADYLPSYTACLGEAIAPFGFVDIEGHFAADAINCMAYYGITKGTTVDRYSPNQPITRWQMALFLTRAARAVGITLPEATDQGFGDMGHLGPNTQAAINRLAALGITGGTSATTFHPDVVMDRRQMAIFLYRFLLLASKGPGGADISRVVPDDTVFEDLAGQREDIVTAIRVIYELGVTVGTTATTFSPLKDLTRAQMALFVTRALAHTNARPAGISVQNDTPVVSTGDTLEVHVSVRDANFRPRAGSLVDVFSTPADDPFSAFDSNGACLRGVEVAFGGRVCTIDQSDRRLDELGNLLVVLEPTDDVLLWAWTGSVDEEFRFNSTAVGSTEIEVQKAASAVRVRDDMPHTASALRMGDTVEAAFQLVDDDGRPVREAGVRVQLTTTYEANGVTDRTNTKTYRTNNRGSVTIPFRATDPDRVRSDDSVTLDIDVVVTGLDVLDETTLGVVADDSDDVNDALFVWYETVSVASTLRLRQTVTYHQLPRSGPGPANAVRAILTDQYGDPVPGAQIEFSSKSEEGLGTDPVTKDTDRNGVATVRYLWNGSKASSEVISAETSGGNVEAVPVNHYWAVPLGGGNSALAVPILLSDVNKNQILHDAASPKLISYDANDSFSIRDTTVTISVFEEVLASGVYKRISYTRYSTDPEATSSFDLTNTRIFDSS